MGCARVVCRRHFNRPSFPPSNCPLPPVQRNFPRTEEYVYMRLRNTSGITRYIKYIWIYRYTYPKNILYVYDCSCILLYLRSFRAKVLLYDNDTYKGTFMLCIYICARYAHRLRRSEIIWHDCMCVSVARGNRRRLVCIVIIIIIYYGTTIIRGPIKL